MTIPSKLSCIICRKETSNLGIATHIRVTHLGDKSAQLAANAARKGFKSWNSGQTKETDDRILATSLVISKTLTGRPGKVHTDESKRKISEGSKSRGLSGGYREGSGIGKSGRYNGMWCDSSWELAYIIWCQAQGKSIIRNTERFDYVFEGKAHKYLPDFIVDGQLIEIKGRKVPDAVTLAKIASTNGRVKLLLAEDMYPILKSVEHLQPLENLYGG
jgi:hypothetical protein